MRVGSGGSCCPLSGSRNIKSMNVGSGPSWTCPDMGKGVLFV